MATDASFKLVATVQLLLVQSCSIIADALLLHHFVIKAKPDEVKAPFH